MKAKLQVKAGLDELREFGLEAGKTYVIGRSHDADITLSHASVSRHHCKLLFAAPGKWVITDTGSSNGVAVNHRRVSTEVLAHGDTVQLGRIVLEFHLLDAGVPPAPAAPLDAIRPSHDEPVPEIAPPERTAPPPQPTPTPPPVPGPPVAAHTPPPEAAKPPTEITRAPKRRSRTGLLAVAAVAVLGIVVGIVLLGRRHPQPRATGQEKATDAKAGGTKGVPKKKRIARAPRKGTLVKSIKLDDEKGFTPLHAAARKSPKAEVEALLAKGGNVNAWDAVDAAGAVARGVQPLHVAVAEGRDDIVELLLAKGAEVNGNRGFGTPLHMAAATNNVPLALLLLDRGASLNAVDARRQTPLHLAAEFGCEEVAELLADRGSPIAAWNAAGLTPLHLAAGNGHAPVVKLFLEMDADPNLPNSYGLWTPLHEAAAKGRKAVAEVLLAGGANVNAATRTLAGGGRTPLHEALKAGNKEIADLLLRRGADPNARDSDGLTPAQFAASKAGK